MNGLRSRLSGSALTVGVVAVLAAGAGYSLAAGGSTNVINACASKTTGALRVSTHCTSKENALSWNRVGPPGPGARLLVYNTSSPTTNPTLHKVGTAGPWTIWAACVINNLNQVVVATVEFSGPTVTEDVWGLSGSSPLEPATTAIPATTASTATPILQSQSYGGGSPGHYSAAGTFTLIGASGRVMMNVLVSAKSVYYGDSVNSCHASDVVTPLS
jgi:hypothetical protein